MYKLTLPFPGQIEATSVWHTEKKICIPFDPDNTDYQAYLKWLEAGNTPLPADTGA